MLVRTPGRAVRLVLDDLQRSVSCVTRSVLRAKTIGGDARHAVISFVGHPPRAKAGRGRELWMTSSVVVEAKEDDEETGSWRTHTLLYDFSLFDQEEGAKFRLAYHFHPSPGGYQRPHLHVDHSPRWAPRGLRRTHLPTGRIPCERFIRLLLEDLDVTPVRTDWEDVLADVEDRFSKRRTW